MGRRLLLDIGLVLQQSCCATSELKQVRFAGWPCLLQAVPQAACVGFADWAAAQSRADDHACQQSVCSTSGRLPQRHSMGRSPHAWDWSRSRPHAASGPFAAHAAASSGAAWCPQQRRHYHAWYYRSKQLSFRIQACEEADELHGLLQVASNKNGVPKLSFINWAHVLQRLAGIKEAAAARRAAGERLLTSGSSSGRGAVPAEVQAAGALRAEASEAALLQTACEHVRMHAKWYDVRYAGVVVTSLARLKHQDRETIDTLLARAVLRMPEAYSRDLAAVCKGLADLGYASRPAWWSAVMQALRDKLPSDRVPASSLASTLVSALKLQQSIPAELLAECSADMQRRLVAYSPHDVAGMLWLLARTKHSLGEEARAALEQGVTALAGHLEAHEKHCSLPDLVSFLLSASLLLPRQQRAQWAAQQPAQALLRRLAARMEQDAAVLDSMSPSRLVDCAAVFAQLGAPLPDAAAKAHMAAAARALPIMGNTPRASLKEQYEQLGLLQAAARVHPALAKALGVAVAVPPPEPAPVVGEGAAAEAAAAPAGGDVGQATGVRVGAGVMAAGSQEGQGTAAPKATAVARQ